MNNLILFFSKIREITFWERIFYWRQLRNLSYDAFKEFSELNREMDELKAVNHNLQLNHENIELKYKALANQVAQQKESESRNNLDKELLTNKIELRDTRIAELTTSLSKYAAADEQKKQEHDRSIAQLNQLKATFEAQICRFAEEQKMEQEAKYARMKRQWMEHESDVKQHLQMICQNHSIKYIEAVPFKGNPDNTLELCEEYIVFDSKSPMTDDLTNFPKYIRTQTENVKKYANQEKVKKDIFFVIPSSTIHVITQLKYNMADYNVYVVTKEALEPIVLAFKKIEEYEFVNQLSPDERDNICRLIGKFAHTTKRKIQIDQFFASEFLELLVRCKNDLPPDILSEVIEYEKAEKLNPPSERKYKQILTSDLESRHQVMNAEALVRELIIPESLTEIQT